jgi:hypothetical protein
MRPRLQHVVRPKIHHSRTRMMAQLSAQRGKHLIDTLAKLRLNIGVVMPVQILRDGAARDDRDGIADNGHARLRRRTAGQGRGEEYTSHDTIAHTLSLPTTSHHTSSRTYASPEEVTKMLFLYRPPQTYRAINRPRRVMQQDTYNWQMQQAYRATNRVPPRAPAPAPPPRDPVSSLESLVKLHDAGVLTDAEFAKAKAKIVSAP